MPVQSNNHSPANIIFLKSQLLHQEMAELNRDIQAIVLQAQTIKDESRQHQNDHCLQAYYLHHKGLEEESPSGKLRTSEVQPSSTKFPDHPMGSAELPTAAHSLASSEDSSDLSALSEESDRKLSSSAEQANSFGVEVHQHAPREVRLMRKQSEQVVSRYLEHWEHSLEVVHECASSSSNGSEDGSADCREGAAKAIIPNASNRKEDNHSLLNNKVRQNENLEGGREKNEKISARLLFIRMKRFHRMRAVLGQSSKAEAILKRELVKIDLAARAYSNSRIAPVLQSQIIIRVR